MNCDNFRSEFDGLYETGGHLKEIGEDDHLSSNYHAFYCKFKK